MAWAFRAGETDVRLNDLSLAAILRILEGEGDDANTEEVVVQLLASPVSHFGRAVKIAQECAQQAGVADPEAFVAELMDKSWLDFTNLFVAVDDDLPVTVVDGTPPVGDDGSTA